MGMPRFCFRRYLRNRKITVTKQIVMCKDIRENQHMEVLVQLVTPRVKRGMRVSGAGPALGVHFRAQKKECRRYSILEALLPFGLCGGGVRLLPRRPDAVSAAVALFSAQHRTLT